MKRIGRDFITAFMAWLIVVIPASIISGIVLLITRSNDAFMYTLIGTCTGEVLGWALYFRTRPDPETTEEKRA